ncbi:1301_t:CDS:2, partial [Acaulospora colombiana]
MGLKLTDFRLGILYRLFQLLAISYIAYTVIFNEGYLRKEPPIPGAVRITLQAPTTIIEPPYCINGSLPCLYWGANDIQYPSDGSLAFFTTRVSIKKYSPPPGCNFLNVSNPTDPCFFNPISPLISSNSDVIIPKSFIGDIEDYT